MCHTIEITLFLKCWLTLVVVDLVVVDADFLGAGAFFVVVVAFFVEETFFTAGFLVVDLPSLGFLATGLASLTLPLIPTIMGPGHMSTSIAKPLRNDFQPMGVFASPLGRLKTPFSALAKRQGVLDRCRFLGPGSNPKRRLYL